MSNSTTPPAGWRCPHDGGACHHRCAVDADPKLCHRKYSGTALTIAWAGFPVPGDAPVLCNILAPTAASSRAAASMAADPHVVKIAALAAKVVETARTKLEQQANVVAAASARIVAAIEAATPALRVLCNGYSYVVLVANLGRFQHTAARGVRNEDLADALMNRTVLILDGEGRLATVDYVGSGHPSAGSIIPSTETTKHTKIGVETAVTTIGAGADDAILGGLISLLSRKEG